jgi:hypothetical protein
MRKAFITVLVIITAGLQSLAAQEQPYLPGEKITYQIRYGIVGSGIVTLSISDGMYKGEKIWHAVVSVRQQA